MKKNKKRLKMKNILSGCLVFVETFYHLIRLKMKRDEDKIHVRYDGAS